MFTNMAGKGSRIRAITVLAGGKAQLDTWLYVAAIIGIVFSGRLGNGLTGTPVDMTP